MSRGLSFKSFAAVIRVNPATLFDWVKAYDEFYEAKEIGTMQGLLYWEELSRQIASGETRGNVIAMIWNMKNRFKEDWMDKQVIESSNQDSLKITMAYPQMLPPPGSDIIEVKPTELAPPKDDPIKKESEKKEEKSDS